MALTLPAAPKFEAPHRDESASEASFPPSTLPLVTKVSIERTTFQQRHRMPESLKSARFRRAISVAGDVATPAFGWKRDRNPINVVTPQSAGPVGLPVMQSVLRLSVNDICRTAGLPISGAPKRGSPSSSPGPSEPKAKRRRLHQNPPSSLDAYFQRNNIILKTRQRALFELEHVKTRNLRVYGAPRSGKSLFGDVCAIMYGSDETPALLLVEDPTAADAARKRLQDSAPHVDICTFRELARRLFPLCPKSELRVGRPTGSPIWRQKPNAIVVVDNFERCTDESYFTIQSLLTALSRCHPSHCSPRLVLIGSEPRPEVFSGGGDPRFFESAPRLFSTSSSHQWGDVHLKKSWITKPHARFISGVYLKETYLTGSSHVETSQTRPEFVYVDPAHITELCAFVEERIHTFGPRNCAFLARTAKTLAPDHLLRRLLNCLTARGVPITEGKADQMRLSDEEIEGKAVFSSFRQFRDCTRKMIFLFDADVSYFKNFPDGPVEQCPNEILTALTCASRRLVVIQSTACALLPCMRVDQLSYYADVFSIPASACAPQISPLETGPPTTKPQGLSVTYLAAPSPWGADRLGALVKKYLVVDELASTRCSEYVGDVNGIVVTEGLKDRLAGRRREAPQLARAVVEDQARRAGSTQRLRALKDHSYGWLTQSFSSAVDRLAAEFAGTVQHSFEVDLEKHTLVVPAQPQGVKITLRGRVDVLVRSPAGAEIREIKFVGALKAEHLIQPAIYAYLWMKQHKRKIFPRTILFNLTDGHKYDISSTLGNMEELIGELFQDKFRVSRAGPDKEFFKRCRTIRKEIPLLL
ncbi:hypothetical protein C8R47DRAFT_1301977 [Mycena vitilis]|nr:hypothetical protein C8R47DRAFT_1301977 [Mycena vitilis]